MKKVTFQTKSGRTVTFGARSSGGSTHRDPSPFARYVRDHIGAYAKKHDPKTAMRKVAADWRRKKGK